MGTACGAYRGTKMSDETKAERPTKFATLEDAIADIVLEAKEEGLEDVEVVVHGMGRAEGAGGECNCTPQAIFKLGAEA